MRVPSTTLVVTEIKCFARQLSMRNRQLEMYLCKLFAFVLDSKTSYSLKATAHLLSLSLSLFGGQLSCKALYLKMIRQTFKESGKLTPLRLKGLTKAVVEVMENIIY